MMSWRPSRFARRRRSIPIAAIMLLCGCAEITTRPTPPPAPQLELDRVRSAALSAIENWSFRGRAAVQRGDEGWSATLHWQQVGDSFRLRIAAPLGRGTFEIFSHRGDVQLIDANNQVYRSGDPETLLRETTGWELPINDIEYWVRGILRPEDRPTQLNIDDRGLLRDFASHGWRVSYLEYRQTASFDLPRKMFLAHDETKVRLVIASWNLDPGASPQ